MLLSSRERVTCPHPRCLMFHIIEEEYESNKLLAHHHLNYFTSSLPGAVAMLASMLYDTLQMESLLDAIWVRVFWRSDHCYSMVILCFAVADLVALEHLRSLQFEHGKKNHQTANNIFTIALSCLLPQVLSGGIFFFFCAPNVLRTRWCSGKIEQELSTCAYGLFSCQLCASRTPLITSLRSAEKLDVL